MSPVRNALVIAVVLCGAIASAEATPPEELDKARVAFRAGKFEEARGVLTGLLYPHTLLSDPRELAEAHLLLGVTMLEAGQADQADRELEEALLLDPTLSVDPLVFSGRAVALFAKKQKELADRTRGEEEKAKIARERLRLRKLLDNMVVVEKRSYWVNFVPFGAGQFQNGQRKKGMFFLASEAALGGLSASLWSYQVLKYGFRGKVPPEDVDSVNNLQTVQFTSGILCFGFMAWGIADSLGHYEHVVSRRPDPAILKEFERQERDDPAQLLPKTSNFRIVPTFKRGSVGLAFRMKF